MGTNEAASDVAAFIGAQASVVSGGLLCPLGVLVVQRLFPELDAHVAPASEVEATAATTA